MSATEVARVLKVSKRTLETLIKNREAPPYLLVGTQRRWRPRDVEQWVGHLIGAGAIGGRCAEVGGR